MNFEDGAAENAEKFRKVAEDLRNELGKAGLANATDSTAICAAITFATAAIYDVGAAVLCELDTIGDIAVDILQELRSR